MSRNWRLTLALVASSLLALLISLLSNVAASMLIVEDPRLIWIALGATFVLSLPVTLYLFLHETSREEAQPAVEPDKAQVNIDIPTRSYQRFFGREALIDEVMGALREPGRKPIIGLDGMGGIGKTALAREVVERCLAEGLFDTVLWEPKPAQIGLRTIRPLTWNALLVTIGRQLGAPDIQSIPDAEKELRLAALLQTQKVLLILDNLETVVRDQDELSRRLSPFLSHSKSIMTSRQRFKSEVYSIHLKGLQEEDGIQLIRYEAGERGVERVAAAESQDLQKIAKTTGGSPLALKLVVGQLQHLPLETVIQNLQEVQLIGEETDESDYVRFYKSIFWNSWQLLTEMSQRLLVSMSIFSPGVGGSLEAIQAVSNLDPTVLTGAIDELWRFSFLETGEKSLHNPRYYLHPLTQYFVVSDIIRPPSD